MSKQASSPKGKGKDGGSVMELVDNEEFLTRLTQLFESKRQKGTIWLTHKRYSYDPEGDATKSDDRQDDIEYPCLLRATDGHLKFETKILASDLPRFHGAYGTLLKSSMSITMRKRDKKREKHKAEHIALKKKKLLDTIVVRGPKRGNGRKMRQRRMKAAIKQEEARRYAAKREEERIKEEES